jgi:flagellar biosynthesis/type III secretory pathway M-ring protein FliF/YscJ
MVNPIEFPEFHCDMKLQQQLSELQGKYSKLQTTKNILWTVVIALGGCFVIFILVNRTKTSYTVVKDSLQQKDEDKKPAF